MTRQHESHARVIRGIARAPQPLTDGKVRCAACSAAVTLTPVSRRIRAHKTPAGEECPYRASYGHVELADLPPIEMPTARNGPGLAEPATPGRSRLDAGSKCRDCGVWLPGERAVCGSCFAARPR